MKNTIIDSIGRIDDEMIESVAVLRQSHKHYKIPWVKLTAAAVLCFGAVICGLIIAANRSDTETNNFDAKSTEPETNHVQMWNDSFTADEYFKYSDSDNYTGVTSDKMLPPFAEGRDFSDKREAWEAKGMLPVMDTHPLFDASAFYNEDGSLYDVIIAWHRRDEQGLQHYSDLQITAGYKEVGIPDDCIYVEIDENGNVIEEAVTVTQRDGVNIVARGGENREKTITFQNDNGWYRISGSFNDSYEDVAALLDWVWEHPIDFTEFSLDSVSE